MGEKHPGTYTALWRAGNVKAVLEYRIRQTSVTHKDTRSTPGLLFLLWSASRNISLLDLCRT